MKVTVHETFRLRPGDTIRMAGGSTAQVLRVNACSATIREHTVREVTVEGRTFTARSAGTARISPNSEVEIIHRSQAHASAHASRRDAEFYPFATES